MKLCYVLVIFCASIVLAACGADEDAGVPLTAAEQAGADSVLALLRTLDRAAIDRAFSHLPDYSYTRTTRLEQSDAEDRTEAVQEHTVSFEGADHAPRLIRTSTDGTFPDSFWADDDTSASVSEDTTALAQLMLPVEPTFLSDRGREAYHYQALPDTMWNQMQVRRFEVSARPGTGDNETLRTARLYLDTASNTLIGLDVYRVQSSLLYEEESRFHLQLQKGPEGQWLPQEWAIDTRSRILFFEPRHFRRQAVYGDFVKNGTE